MMMGWTLFSLGFATTAQAAEISVSARGHASNPVWSQDGKKLAFELNDNSGKIGLYVVSVNSGSPEGIPRAIQLSTGGSAFGGSGGSVTTSPTWHPKGYLYFEGSFSGGSNRIYMSALTRPAQAIMKSSDLPGDLSWTSLSADGEKLVFVSDSTGEGDIYTFSTRGRTIEHLIKSEHSEMAPRFDKEGRLAYTRKRGGAEDLFVFQNGSSKDWAKGNGDQTRPIWAGDAVAYFTSERGNNVWDVATTSSNGTKKILAQGARLPFRAPPAISPDGQWVAYGLEDTEKSGKIWFSRTDGSKTVSFDTGFVACGEPALISGNGEIFLAYTALPSEGSAWRQLHVQNVSHLIQ